MPLYHLTLTAQKPRNPAYPAQLVTLGDHIRKRRLDLGLLQRDVAVAVNATTSTATNWEKNRTTPRLHYLPKIYEFLGGNPLKGNATSLAESTKQYRFAHGLSLRKLAKLLMVDPGTVAKWEKGRSLPGGKAEQRLRDLLEVDRSDPGRPQVSIERNLEKYK